MIKKITIPYLLIAIVLANLPLTYSQPIPITADYVNIIMQKVGSNLIYPTEAFQKGWEGIVKVRFTLAADGRVKQIDIAESSGYPLLDAAAILAVKDASPYPFPQSFSREKELEITLPINYASDQENVQTGYSPEELFSRVESVSQEAYAPGPPQAPAHTAGRDYSDPRGLDRTQPRGAQTPDPAPYSKELILPKNPELRKFIEIALKNNQPTQVAKQEVDLAELRVQEAKRGLFPGVKVTAYNTYGESYKIDTEEREAKLQIDQPIYYGGRLGDTLKQANVSLDIARRNFDRLRLDVIQQTETAYYNLIAARMHIREKEALLKEAEGLLKKIDRLAAEEMIIPLEAASAHSWFDKIRFQIDAIKQDLFMAELTFRQILNLKENPEIKGDMLEARKLDLDFDRCLEVALNNRPEIVLSQMMVKFNEFGKKIELKKNDFTVDLTTAIGHYQGAYETEDMNNSTNWYIGIKATKPLGASTLTTSAAADYTDERLGQTSPTNSKTVSAEFNFLDNMRRFADQKKADIDLSRSISDFNEAAKSVTFQMQDAFLNYQKAVLQLNEAGAEMKFRRHESTIAEVRASVGEASLSSALESLYSLADAQTNYIQALANFSISIANIKKASGYALDI